MTATLHLTFSSPSSDHQYPMMVTASATDDGFSLSASAQAQDKVLGGALSRAAGEADFKGKAGQTLVVRGGEGTVIVIGTGKELSAGKTAEDLGGHVFSAFSKANLTDITLVLDDDDGECVADIAHGAHLASYVFKHYFTKGDAAKVKMKSLTIQSKSDAEAQYSARA